MQLRNVLVYLDDILCYTETMAEQVKLVRAVLEKLQKGQLYAKLSKCKFHKIKFGILDLPRMHRNGPRKKYVQSRSGRFPTQGSNCKASLNS